MKWFTVAVKDLYLPNSIFLLHIFIAGNIYQILTFFKTNDHLFNIKNIFNTLQRKRISEGSLNKNHWLFIDLYQRYPAIFGEMGVNCMKRKIPWISDELWYPRKPAFVRKQKRHQKVCIKKFVTFHLLMKSNTKEKGTKIQLVTFFPILYFGHLQFSFS